MTMKMMFLKSAAAAALCVAATGTANAVIFGSVWINDFSSDASIVPAGTADLTFTTSLIDYDSTVTGYTIAQFLNNPVFLTGGALSGGTANNIHIRLTGATFLSLGANNFVVPHDDGVVIDVAGIGLVLNQPGPTSPVNTPFVVNAPSAGLYNFTLDYNETLGAPARLAFQVNGAPVTGTVPEPATWGLLLGGFAITGVALRRRRRYARVESIA